MNNVVLPSVLIRNIINFEFAYFLIIVTRRFRAVACVITFTVLASRSPSVNVNFRCTISIFSQRNIEQSDANLSPK